MAARTKEERIAAIDEKIKKKRTEIKLLEEKKKQILNPVSMRSVLSKAKEAGMTPEEVADKLGIKL